MELHGADTGRQWAMPLPTRILRLREDAVSLFVPNIPEDLANPELEAMFWRAGKILDSSIPIDKISGKKQASLLSDWELSKKLSVQWSWFMADHGEVRRSKCRSLNINWMRRLRLMQISENIMLPHNHFCLSNQQGRPCPRSVRRKIT